MMNKYRYGNLSQPGLYIDETTMRMCFTHRRWFANLITNLVKEGKKDMALKALDKCEKEIPSYNVPHDISSASLDIADAFIECGKPERAVPILEQIEKHSKVYFASSVRDCHQEVYALATIQDYYNKISQSNATKAADYGKKAIKMDSEIQALYSAFMSKCENAGIQLQ